jgi:hypothetical protein
MGLLDVLVSDRDMRFTSAFWTGLHAALGASLIFGSPHHNNTTSKVERVYSVIADVLHSSAFTGERADWPDFRRAAGRVRHHDQRVRVAVWLRTSYQPRAASPRTAASSLRRASAAAPADRVHRRVGVGAALGARGLAAALLVA